MSNRITKLSREIAAILLDAVPGGQVILALFGEDIEQALDKLYSSREPHRIVLIANKIAEDIASLSGVTDHAPGTAVSAAHDILDSIRRSSITFEVLLECELREEKLYARLQGYKPEDWDRASELRKNYWERAARCFCKAVINEIILLPEFQAHLLKKLFQQQVHLLREQKAKQG